MAEMKKCENMKNQAYQKHQRQRQPAQSGI